MASAVRSDAGGSVIGFAIVFVSLVFRGFIPAPTWVWFVVLGVGVNANQTEDELPEETQHPPTSLRVELGTQVDRPHLLAAILLQLERAYDAWNARGTAAGG